MVLSNLRPFLGRQRLALAIAAAINILVLVNVIFHHPKIGYDVAGHLDNVAVYPLRLPGPEDGGEFFSAPLPYLLPSIVDKFLDPTLSTVTRRTIDSKFMQSLNIFLSLGITILLWKIAETLKPGSETFKISLFAMLEVLTVYYKTFSQARGEPYVAFFVALVFYMTLKHLERLSTLTWRDGAKFGLVLGLLILSRQWGFFIFPALAGLAGIILLKHRTHFWRYARMVTAAVVTAFFVGGWFYLHLFFSFGSFTTFNREPSGFSFSNQPLDFYITTFVPSGKLFQTPVREEFNETMMPIFYSDVWGDYWGYFTYIHSDLFAYKANGETMIPYLGRVNLVSIYPSLILLAGLAFGAIALWRSLSAPALDPRQAFQAFLFLFVLVSWLGFLWFLISYPILPSEINNKATYMIQIFMALPLLAAGLLDRLRAWRAAAYSLAVLLLALVTAHNLPAMVTRFNWFLMMD